MASATQRAKRRKQRDKATHPKSNWDFRTFAVRAATVDEEGRSVEALIATETPVVEFDYERWEFVPTVLLTSGVQLPATRQVPLLNNHQRWDISDQLGSIREIRGEAAGVVGLLNFSTAAEDEWTKVREGHVSDVSAGFVAEKKIYVPEGKTRKVRGQEFTGPVNVVTRWRLREGSITPIGADEQAKIRGLAPETVPTAPQTESERDFEGFTMDEKLKALLVARGMDAELSDDEAQDWMIENQERVFSAAGDPPADDPPQDPPAKPGKRNGDDVTPAAPLTPADLEKMVDRAMQDREERRAAFRSEVDQLCELAGVPNEFARGLYSESDLAKARKAILDEKQRLATDVPGAPVISFGPAQRDKHRGALQTALMQRVVASTEISHERQEHYLPQDKRSEGWEDFRHASLIDIATECLRMDGVNVRGLTRHDIAICALGFPHQVGVRTDGGYHVTGSFAKLTQDAINKSMMMGFEEFPATWRMVFRQGNSVPDFKTIHRMQLGGVPNLPVWNDADNPTAASFKDEEETYAVEARSLKIGFSYRLLVNDDMDVLSRTPFRMGTAASRTVNTVAWSQITSNPTMRDGQALFLATPTGNRKRSNLTTGAGAPATATVQTLTGKMMQMRGVNTPEENESEDLLALMPRYIVGPSALRTTILQLVRSIADPSSSNSGVANINNNLVPVIEPLLDANSTVAWYLFADKSQADSVEVTFLQGQETPQTREVMNEEKLSRDYYILQTFNAKALEHRGVQRHDGQ